MDSLTIYISNVKMRMLVEQMDFENIFLKQVLLPLLKDVNQIQIQKIKELLYHFELDQFNKKLDSIHTIESKQTESQIQSLNQDESSSLNQQIISNFTKNLRNQKQHSIAPKNLQTTLLYQDNIINSQKEIKKQQMLQINKKITNHQILNQQQNALNVQIKNYQNNHMNSRSQGTLNNRKKVKIDTKQQKLMELETSIIQINQRLEAECKLIDNDDISPLKQKKLMFNYESPVAKKVQKDPNLKNFQETQKFDFNVLAPSTPYKDQSSERDITIRRKFSQDFEINQINRKSKSKSPFSFKQPTNDDQHFFKQMTKFYKNQDQENVENKEFTLKKVSFEIQDDITPNKNQNDNQQLIESEIKINLNKNYLNTSYNLICSKNLSNSQQNINQNYVKLILEHQQDITPQKRKNSHQNQTSNGKKRFNQELTAKSTFNSDLHQNFNVSSSQFQLKNLKFKSFGIQNDFNQQKSYTFIDN